MDINFFSFYNLFLSKYIEICLSKIRNTSEKATLFLVFIILNKKIAKKKNNIPSCFGTVKQITNILISIATLENIENATNGFVIIFNTRQR